MLNNTAALLLASTFLILVGCSSDDDGNQPVDSMDNTDDNSGNIAGENPNDISGDNSSDGAGNNTSTVPAGAFRISVTNLMSGQPMTPPVVAIHDADFHLFEVGENASPQVQVLAENGDSVPLLGFLGVQNGVSDSGSAFVDGANPVPFFSNETATVTLQTDAADQVFSVINMIVCTNDGFAGADSLALPVDFEIVSYMGLPYDARTEQNVLDSEYWVPLCGGSDGNLHDDEFGVITAHPGQTGVGDYNFVGIESVVRIDVERLESAAGRYEIAFSNNSIGQPMTPPVAVLHDPSIQFFNIGSDARPEIKAIAEDGNNDPILDLVRVLPEVSASGLAYVDAENPGTIQPGETATVTLETDSATHVLSAINMIVCTNDGFTGINSAQLPSGTDTVTFEAVPYDAGTEINVLDLDYWVSSCGGSGENLHEVEDSSIAIHPGQTGVGNFDFVGTDAILTVSITRTDTPENVGDSETGGNTIIENTGAAQTALQ